MSISRVVDVRCDFWAGGKRCARSELVAPVSLGASGATRMTNQEARDALRPSGWTYEFGPSSCLYDLCPDHRMRRPGVDFPDWRKG